MDKPVLDNAKAIWNYFQGFNSETSPEVIVVCCSYDLRVCDYACDLLSRVDADVIIFSGNTGNWTRDLWNKPEAEIFRDRAIELGVDASKIVTEVKSTNLGENISFTQNLFDRDANLSYVSKANTLLRIKLTLAKQIGIEASFSAPTFNFPNEVSDVIGVEGLINEMVGDINRIIHYPALGFQVTHELPLAVKDAYQFLLANGFDEHIAN